MLFARAQILLYLFIFHGAFGAIWDVEYWQFFNYTNWQRGRYLANTVLELRFKDNLSRFGYLRISENFVYRFSEKLDFQTSYGFLYLQNLPEDKFFYINRLCFESNITLPLQCGNNMRWRNRIDVVKREKQRDIRFVLRERVMLYFPIKNRGNLIAIDCYDEFFYDFHTGLITQNRLVPLEVTLKLSKSFDLSLFVMLRNRFSFFANQWVNSFVFGTQLNF